jgi:DNA-binding HxlR family transcriptional regulator
MPPPVRHVGHATLQLLVEPFSVPILRALMDGPSRPSELEQRLPGVPHSAIGRRLSELRRRGLAQYNRRIGLPPAATYVLTPPGRMILGVTSAAERWERRWTDETADGLIALRLISDEHAREILLALAAAPLSAGEVMGEVRLTRSPLRQRLSDLVSAEILTRTPGETHATYELTSSARDLMLVSVAAARWAWEFAEPPEQPTATYVARVLEMYAPTVNLAADVRGLCRLEVEGDRVEVVHLAASGRTVQSLPEPPDSQPDSTCRADTRAWCDGLLLHRWDAIRLSGATALMGAILPCLSAALLG